MSDVITVAEMQEGQVYKTCESDLSYFSKLVSKEGEKVKLTALMPKSRKWKELEVPASYKVRAITAEEQAQFAELDKPRVKRERKPKDPNAPKKESASVTKGVITNKRMLDAWGYYINEFIDVEGGRSKVIEAMNADFPSKAESITKWVDSYLTYYNTGRLAKWGYGRQNNSKVWKLSADELAAGLKPMASRDLNKVRVPKAVRQAAKEAGVPVQ